MKLNIGILGAAKITPAALIEPANNHSEVNLVNLAARDVNRAKAFAEQYNVKEVLQTYDDVIESADTNAIYIPLPISAHHEWCVKALNAGKHVLCEKSLTSNFGEANNLAVLAQERKLILMEAFHYRYHPLFQRAIEIYQSGILGEVSEIDAQFSVPITDESDIRMIYEQGGGVTMDIGCYPLSWIRHLTGEEPEVMSAEAETANPQVDVMLSAKLRLPSGIIAHSVGDMRTKSRFKACITVTGSQGIMHVENPLVPQFGNRIEIRRDGSETVVEKFTKTTTYQYQLEAFVTAVQQGRPPFTDAVDAVAQLKLIDACYRAAGLKRRGLKLS